MCLSTTRDIFPIRQGRSARLMSISRQLFHFQNFIVCARVFVFVVVVVIRLQILSLENLISMRGMKMLHHTFLWCLLKPLNSILFCLRTHTNKHIRIHTVPYSHILNQLNSSVVLCTFSFIHITFYALRIYIGRTTLDHQNKITENEGIRRKTSWKKIHSHVFFEVFPASYSSSSFVCSI